MLFGQCLLLWVDYHRSAGEGESTPLQGQDQAHLGPRVQGAGPYPRESLLLDGSNIPRKPGHCPSTPSIPEALRTSGIATGSWTRTKGIYHGWSEGVS